MIGRGSCKNLMERRDLTGDFKLSGVWIIYEFSLPKYFFNVPDSQGEIFRVSR